MNKRHIVLNVAVLGLVTKICVVMDIVYAVIAIKTIGSASSILILQSFANYLRGRLMGTDKYFRLGYIRYPNKPDATEALSDCTDNTKYLAAHRSFMSGYNMAEADDQQELNNLYEPTIS
jgi:hypothetical protein